MSFPDDRHRIAGAAARRILVAGATGRFGGIVDLLLAHGHAVRAATRDPARPEAARLAALGADIVHADFEDGRSFAAAARSMDAVFASGSAHRAGPAGEQRHGRNLRRLFPGSAHPTWSSSPGPGRTSTPGFPSFTCPPGQSRFLDAVSYSNTQLTDEGGNTIHATQDPISATLHIRV